MKKFVGIETLYTFSGVAEKNGRHANWEDLSPISDAALLVNDKGRIVFSGPRKLCPKVKSKTVSLGGRVVLPSFVECHTHLLYGGNRASEFEMRNQGLSYLKIAEAGGGIRSTVKATETESPANLKRKLRERLQEFASQGVTTVEIKTGYAGSIEEEVRQLKLLARLRSESDALKSTRLVITSLAAHSIPSGWREADWLNAVEQEIFPIVAKLSARIDIFIENGAFSRALGEAFLKSAIRENLKFVVHADQLSLSGGTELGAKLGAQSVDHVIEVGEREIRALAKSDTVAVLLPAADLYTRLPFPKARAMIDAGVRVALATDHNPGSSPGLDLALVGVLARASMQMSLAETLVAYTYNAAGALGLENQIGALTENRLADFLVLKPGADLASLFYEIGPTRSMAAVDRVYRSGREF